MEYNIYGLFDAKTGNIGDLCMLRCDQEFIDGMTKFFGGCAVPDYVVEDLKGLSYGKIIVRHGHYPEIQPFEVPKVVLYGRDILAVNRSKEDNNG